MLFAFKKNAHEIVLLLESELNCLSRWTGKLTGPSEILQSIEYFSRGNLIFFLLSAAKPTRWYEATRITATIRYAVLIYVIYVNTQFRPDLSLGSKVSALQSITTRILRVSGIKKRRKNVTDCHSVFRYGDAWIMHAAARFLNLRPAPEWDAARKCLVASAWSALFLDAAAYPYFWQVSTTPSRARSATLDSGVYLYGIMQPQIFIRRVTWHVIFPFRGITYRKAMKER